MFLHRPRARTQSKEIKLLAKLGAIKMLTTEDFEQVNFPFEIFDSDNQLLSKNHDQLENIDYFSFFNFNNLKNSKENFR